MNEEINNQVVESPVVETKSDYVVRDIFVNIAMMLSLGVAIMSFITLIQLVLDTVLPDHFNCGCDFTETIINNLVILIVSYSAYFYLSWKMRKTEGALPLHHSTVFHKIIVYLTLFVSGIGLSYKLVEILQEALYYGFSVATGLKIGILAVVFGGIFAYYFSDIKKSGDVAHSKLAVVSWWVMNALVVGAIVGAFLVVGSPNTQKNMRFDEKRIYDLSGIQDDIDSAISNTSTSLPATLQDFYSEEHLNTLLDPQYNQPYEYKVVDKDSYQLCSTFGAPSDTYARKLQKVYGENAKNTKDIWAHESGRTCFTFSVKRYRYEDSSSSYDYSNSISDYDYSNDDMSN